MEAVITCVSYGDILAHTLRDNRHLFDRIVVVTSHTDKRTHRVCEYLHVQCVKTDAFKDHLGHFCKGAAINVGLKHLDMDGWVMQLDADIALPPLTRRLLEKMDLEKSCLYGFDRVNVKGYEEWMKFIDMPRLQQEDECWVHMNQFPFGTRVAIHNYGGYIPIGFAQLFCPSASGVYEYPQGHTNAAREDTAFALLWPRSKRHLLPEIVAYHLESEDAKHGINWGGRQSKPFTVDGK